MKRLLFPVCLSISALGLACDKTDQATPAPESSLSAKALTAENAKPPSPAAPTESPVERGKYLVTGMGCSDCHTPKKMGLKGPELDMTKLLSGQPADDRLPPPPALTGPWVAVTNVHLTAWKGPWGMSYSANITSDPETGIGNWTEETFVAAMKTGKHMGAAAGRPILPPMPWPAMSQLKDDDLKAMFAYLKTVPAVKNKVPEPVMAPPPPGAPGGAPPKK